MTTRTDFLLIGGGLASAFNAETLRREGALGKIIILAAEHFFPYYRPQLPKAYMLEKCTKEQMLIFPEHYYKKNNIEVLLNTKALSINPEQKTVKTDNSGDFHYNQLLIATGCSPRKVNIQGSHLAGIHYLKTFLDAEPIIQEIKQTKSVVIWGGSFIGIELASLLIKKNIQVTVITHEFVLFNVSPSTEISTFLENHGVNVLLHETIIKFNGKTQVQSVETSTGKTLACDFAIITEEYLPDIDFIHGSGIEINDGVVVDQYLQTNKTDIYAAGDVAKFYDPIFKIHHRNGGVDNAMKQGRISALNMLGMRKCYNTASYFYFQAFEITVVIIGDTTYAKEKIIRGSFDNKSIAYFYLDKDILQGAFFYGRPIEEIKAAESLILNRVNLKTYKTQLADLDFSLEGIATQIVLTLQGGGALGAFECGVVKAMEEHKIYPDIVSGISIGAFNSAIIASNPRHATEALQGFWNDLALNMPPIADEQTRRLLSSWHAIMWGSPNFFYPRWAMPMQGLDQLPLYWTSFYDTSFVKNLLCKYVDFATLKDSPTRLLVMAVNVETSEFETFDSYTDDLTPEHILASGSLPPGFPWTTINGKHYWDGGIVTNTPIDATLDVCGSTNKKIYIVELYSRKRALPQNMIEVLARKDEILFSEKIRKDINTRQLISSFKKLVDGILTFCEPEMVQEVRQHPAYIQLMGDSRVLSITRIIRNMNQEDEPNAWDSDFSRDTIENHIEKGYEITKKLLQEEAMKNSEKAHGFD
jgi:NADPH-dependent 2,4-dienoyl-CoA reductase/sulfur reductase-like enzyme/predicted acylesterase/phospholipase RssA